MRSDSLSDKRISRADSLKLQVTIKKHRPSICFTCWRSWNGARIRDSRQEPWCDNCHPWKTCSSHERNITWSKYSRSGRLWWSRQDVWDGFYGGHLLHHWKDAKTSTVNALLSNTSIETHWFYCFWHLRLQVNQTWPWTSTFGRLENWLFVFKNHWQSTCSALYFEWDRSKRRNNHYLCSNEVPCRVSS